MSSIKIKEFPADDQLWRIEWIGQIFYAPDDEFRIRIHISRLNPNAPKAKVLHNTSLDGYKDNSFTFRSIDLKIGFIQLLKIGSVWVNGEPQLDYRAPEETFEISDPTTLEIKKLTNAGYERVSDKIFNPILTNRQYRVAEDVRRDSYVAVMHGHPKYKQVIIPSTVIFQTCYVTSPKAASKIIFGQLDKLIDLDQSGFIESDERVFRVHIHKDYTNNEGVMLANLAASKVARNNLNLLRQNLVVLHNTVDNSKRKSSIKVGLPFSEHTRLQVRGKDLVYEVSENGEMKQERGFLVSEIVSLKTKFPFNSILPMRKNDGRKGKNPEGELKGAYGGISAGSIEPGEPVELTGADVTAYIQDTQIHQPSVIDLSAIKIMTSEKEHQKYRSMPFKSPELANPTSTGAGSGEKRQITTGSSQLNIALSPVSLESFFEVLQHLRNNGLDVKELDICNAALSKQGTINYFPRKITGCFSWHLRKDKLHPRAFVLAQISTAGKYYYLIDIESKGSGGLSIALLRTSNYQATTPQKLSGLMRDIARKNGWSILKNDPVYKMAFEFYPIDHDRKGDTAKVAKNILKRL